MADIKNAKQSEYCISISKNINHLGFWSFGVIPQNPVLMKMFNSREWKSSIYLIHILRQCAVSKCVPFLKGKCSFGFTCTFFIVPNPHSVFIDVNFSAFNFSITSPVQGQIIIPYPLDNSVYLTLLILHGNAIGIFPDSGFLIICVAVWLRSPTTAFFFEGFSYGFLLRFRVIFVIVMAIGFFLEPLI